jgi:hypothetical protein
VTAVRPDGLNPEQIEKFSQMHRWKRTLAQCNQSKKKRLLYAA